MKIHYRYSKIFTVIFYKVVYAILALSGINITMFVKFFSLSLLPLFNGASSIWQSGAKPGVWGPSPQPSTAFTVFVTKNTHTFKHTFYRKRTYRTCSVSAVSNRQYRNILVGLPKSLGMSKSKNLAKINKRRMQLY